MKSIEVTVQGHGNVINLGSMVDNVISNSQKLSKAGEEGVAEALKALSNAIERSSALVENEKKKYLEQLTVLSEQAIIPENERLPKSVLQPLISFGLGTLGAASDLSQVWSTWEPVLTGFFLS